MSIYRCPECKLVATIDGLKIEVTLPPKETSFPLHPGCELGKPINDIDLSKLVRVG